MGKRGPTPNPNSMRSQKGRNTYGGTLADVPISKLGKARMPRWLSRDAKSFWKKYGPKLAARGLLTRLDQTAFVLLCERYSDYMETEKIIKNDGRFFKSPSGLQKAHPAVKMSRDALRDFWDLARDFGMTPLSRSRVPIPRILDEDEDEMGAFLKRNKNLRLLKQSNK